jgi:hypothetical protein
MCFEEKERERNASDEKIGLKLISIWWVQQRKKLLFDCMHH